MKKLLKILTLLTISTPSVISVVACGSAAPPSTTNLASITELTNLDLIVDTSQPLSSLKNQITKSTQFSSRPITDYVITFWDSSEDGTQYLNDDLQEGKDYYIVIFALPNDPNWTGATSNTNRIKITLKNNFREVPGVLEATYSLLHDSTNNITYAGTSSDIAHNNGKVFKDDGGGEFSALPTAPGAVFAMVLFNDDLYIGVQSNDSPLAGGVYKFEANTWNLISGTTGIIRSLLVTNNGKLYAGSEETLFTGKVYQLVSGTFQAITGTSGAIVSLVSDSSNNVYAGSLSGASTVGEVYKYTGSGSFTLLSGTTGWVISLTIDSSNNLFVLTEVSTAPGRKIYKYNGTTFTELNVPTEAPTVIIMNPLNGGLYAGTQLSSGIGAVYRYDSSSNDWILMTGIVGNVLSLTVDNLGRIIAGTQGDLQTNGNVFITNN